MKQFNRFLCFVMALVTLALCVAACGAEEPQETEPPVTTVGETTTVPTTTAPTTTSPTGNETTVPPVTNPPETGAPCAVHTFAEGKLCTEERACTVCGETVPAGEHAYDNLPCTIERRCPDCGFSCSAEEEHVYGETFACGTRYCQNCLMVSYGNGCMKDCPVCGLEPLATIPFISIDGVAIESYTIVTPVKEKHGVYGYEYYLSALMRHKISVWHEVELVSVTDDVEKRPFEIRIGKTNRTVTECGEDESIIRVVDGGMEILCGTMYSFDGLIQKLSQLLSTQSSKGLELCEGDVFTQSYVAPEKDKKDGDLRVLFHNVYAASKTDELDFVSRLSSFQMVYQHYLPDVVGTQENGGMGYNVQVYLETLGYRWVKGTHGQRIFYNSNTVELYDQDSYGYVSGNSGYGTQWALFRHIKTGSVFGVGSSHFSANSVAGDDPVKGNTLRVGDAKTVIVAKQNMLNYVSTAGLEDWVNTPLIFGGDYNCNTMGEPITQVIANPNSGLHNVKSVIKDPADKDDYATMSAAPVWNKAYNYHVISPYTPYSGSGQRAIDHIYLYAEGVRYTANQYRIIHSLSSRGCADHTPHYVDLSFQ